MSFSSKRTICYLINQFHYSLLIKCIKTSAVLKRQRFEDSKSDEMESRKLKRQQLHVHDNEEAQGLGK